MSEMTEDFNARLESWLEDPHAKHLPSEQYTRRPSDGHYAAIRAYEEITTNPEHDACGRDTRDRTVLVRIVGQDYVDTVVPVDADTVLACFLAALRNDESLVGFQVLGWDPDEVDPDDPEPDPQVTVSEGMRIESEVEGLVSTFTPFPAEDDGPAHLAPSPPSRLARIIAWLRS